MDFQADIDKAVQAADEVSRMLADAIPRVFDMEMRELLQDFAADLTRVRSDFEREAPKVFAELEKEHESLRSAAEKSIAVVAEIRQSLADEETPAPAGAGVSPIEPKDESIGPSLHSGVLKRYFAPVPPARTANDINFDSWIARTNVDSLPAASPASGLEALRNVAGDLERAGVRLGDRHAIWWSILTMTHACGIAGVRPTDADAAVVRDAVRWMMNESVDIGKAFAPIAGSSSLAGSLALAILRAGSRSTAGSQLPGPPTSSFAAVQSVALAGQLNDGVHASAIYQAALTIAAEIASGRNLWPGAEAPATVPMEQASWSDWLVQSVSNQVAVGSLVAKPAATEERATAPDSTPPSPGKSWSTWLGKKDQDG